MTGLRGLAACYVVLYHYFGVGGDQPVIGTMRSHGYLAVDLFFVLSGFVIAFTYAPSFLAGATPGTYAIFIYRRLGRIYPLYLVVTLACMAVGYVAFTGPLSWTDLIKNLSLVEAWGSSVSIAGPSWSISTEFAAYLLFPALVVATLRSGRGMAVLASSFAIGCLLALGSLPEAMLHAPGLPLSPRRGPLDIYDSATAYPLLRCLAEFSLGLVAYRLACCDRLWRQMQRRGAADAVALLALALLAVPGSDVVLVLVLMPLIIGLAAGRGVAAWLLASPVLHWLGLVSYSIYLLHSPLQQTCWPWLDASLAEANIPHAGGIALVAVIVLLVASSAATYRLIEQPAREWSRKLFPARSQHQRA